MGIDLNALKRALDRNTPQDDYHDKVRLLSHAELTEEEVAEIATEARQRGDGWESVIEELIERGHLPSGKTAAAPDFSSVNIDKLISEGRAISIPGFEPMSGLLTEENLSNKIVVAPLNPSPSKIYTKFGPIRRSPGTLPYVVLNFGTQIENPEIEAPQQFNFLESEDR